MNLIKRSSIFFLFAFAAFTTLAQDKRTVKTTVADILTYLPAEDNAQALRLYGQLIALGDEGIAMITGNVQPNGIADAVPYRFAVSLLTHYATSPADKALIEKNYLAALGKATNAEVKSYFMDNIKIVGSDAAVKPLTTFFIDKDLWNQAIGTVQEIGSLTAREALLKALPSASGSAQARLVQALGELKYQPALSTITPLASASDVTVKKHALRALAMIADPGSAAILEQAAAKTGFKPDPSEATLALIQFINVVKNTEVSAKLAKTLVDNTAMKSTAPEKKAGTVDVVSPQQVYHLAAVEAYCKAAPDAGGKLLLAERNVAGDQYRKEILKIAVPLAQRAEYAKAWEKEYKKSKGIEQAEILYMLSSANRDEAFTTASLIPALLSLNGEVRMTAASEIAARTNKKFAEPLVAYMLRCTDEKELTAAKSDVLILIDHDNTSLLTSKLASASPANKTAIIQLLTERRANESFDAAAGLTTSADPKVREAAYTSLAALSGPSNVTALLKILSAAQTDDETKAVQRALSVAVDAQTSQQVVDAYAVQKGKLIPVLPYLNDAGSLDKITSALNAGSPTEKDAAFGALVNWQNGDAIRTLLNISKDANMKGWHAKAFAAALAQIPKSSAPDDEKLLFIRAAMDIAADKQERNSVLRAAGGVRTFLSLVFVSGYLDDAEVGAAAGRAAMQLSLPTADAKPGMTGRFVRQTLEHMQEKLTGDDSQYERIDIATYLNKLPNTKGYESIFNGKDLTGWQGLVENPIIRSKMKADVLAAKQKEADAKVSQNWSVRDGMIVFQGDGANLCTIRPYGDFEMSVDWRISKNGDSGIYLRGSPQVQIWDIARTDAGAQVGSGGLYNNKKERSTPLVVADNPIGEWNTFRIKMVGDKVTVYLNGTLVVDNVVMENYWDRTLPIFPQEAIELQAHGTDLAFRNIYVKELSSATESLTPEEKTQGFESLFNGKDLGQWVGNKTDYVVEDGAIAIYPAKESHGDLATEKEYSDFTFRFEFQLTPGANNGIGIHAGPEGDAAYAAKEIQVLDDTAPVYAKLEPWQYHGSVYGVIAAKKGFLKPVGEWNKEEIYVKGDYIKVTLNGTVIVDGDMKAASKKGTLDHKDHPGLQRHSGHIEFLGHGTVVRFRNIRIRTNN